MKKKKDMFKKEKTASGGETGKKGLSVSEKGFSGWSNPTMEKTGDQRCPKGEKENTFSSGKKKRHRAKKRTAPR